MSGETESDIVFRLRDLLQACSQLFDSNNIDGSDKAVSTLVQTLYSLSEPAQSNDEKFSVQNHNISEQILDEILQYLSDPKNQILIDALSFEIPKIVAKIGAFSEKCEEISKGIIKLFISNCSPRDMLSILCGALDVEIEEAKSPVYYIILFDALSQVLNLIQRRYIEQIKAMLPVILKVLHNIPFNSLEQENRNIFDDLFKSSIQIGISIQEICKKMDERKEELSAILGLYILQNIALISQNQQKNVISSCTSLILELSKFLPFCGFSYFGLITGSNINSAINQISKEACNEFRNCFSLSKDGACLAVIWAHINEEIAKSTGEDLSSVIKMNQKNQMEFWQAIDMLKYPISSMDYSFEIKNHILDFLVSILDGFDMEEYGDNNLDFSSFMPGIFVTIQGIQRMMMSAFDPSLRKKSFFTLKKIISAIPSSDRFDILKALITNSSSPSMTALLIDLVRGQILEVKKDGNIFEKNENKNGSKSLNLVSYALNLVEMILKPPEGGPPVFPENSEPVLSALNLLRFILLSESSRKSSGTKLLTQEILQKVFADWLLPLRALVSGITRENENDFGEHLTCALNPVQLVLYLCIELVEESMKN
ncbi:hypothetical protein LUZ60_006560 [Juncus effusus]|nr:hypothetical protein LUZ60_006560 [Juncus effusus]